MRDYFTKLLRYTAWADRCILAALRELPAAQQEALPLFAHVLAAEHVWLSRVYGAEARLAVWPQLSLEECAALAGENAAGYEELLQGLGAEELVKPVRYRNTKGVEFVTPLDDILTHVVVHGGYHRGQVARAIGRAGGTTISTDYITFVREGL
ncbi:MAG: damage-inducible protein DinB [Planctomycetes bacterium]|nr:damage-inducible protein DinB [Planctomycetota bacterium]